MSGLAKASAAAPVSVRSTLAGLWSRIPPIAVAYAVPAVVAALAVQTWFRADGALASGDLSPPVVPGSDYRSHWNQFETGAGSPNFQIVSLPYFEGLRLFARLGFSETTSQRVWLTLLAAGAAAAVVFLARGLVQSPLAVAVAGLLATFNAYRLTTTFESLPLVAMIAAGVLGGLVIRAGGERRPRPLAFALASTSCAFVFLNPPHLALVLAWLAASVVLALAVHGRRAAGRVGAFLSLAAPLALLFNLWWIVPAALTITNPLFGARFAAAGVQEWAWTQVRGDLRNVVALTSSWAWGRAEYFPFSVGLERFPFAALGYVPAAAAVLGLALARGRRRTVALVLLVVGGLAIWAMKGLHGPLGGTNKWLYDHAPGFWLLREPTKAALLLVLVYALLAALGVAHLAASSRPLAQVVAVSVVAGAAVYAHPLLSGAVVPTKRPLLPSAHVRIPDGWRDVARYLDSHGSAGKIVVLPRLDYYQAPTTWGYYGATFLHQLISRPIIDAPLPGGYYRDPVVPELITQLERRALDHDGNVAPLLQALGAKYILLRRDLDTSFPGRSFTPPHLLAQRLRHAPGIRLARSFGVADVYEATNVRDAEIYPAVPLIDSGVTTLPRIHGAVDIGLNTVIVRPAVGRLLTGVPRGKVGIVPAGRPSFLEPQPIRFAPALARRVGDCHQSDSRTLRAVGISARVVGSGGNATLRLAARDHAACVAIAVGGSPLPAALRLRLSFRSLRGNPARLCMWQDGPDRCVRSRGLAASRGWHRLDRVVRLADGSRSARLFLYADGGGRRTITEYRRLTVARLRPTTGTAVAPIVRLPDVSYQRVSPSEFRVHVRRAHGPFLLVAAETFASGWRIDAPGHRSGAVTHMRVNDYANGWRIPWAGSYRLTIEYGPERLARFARHLDLVAVPLGLLALLWRPKRSVWKRLRRTSGAEIV